MIIPHNKFCILPWISLEAGPVGTVRPCCLADEIIRDDNGIPFDLNTATFSSIQKSNDMQQLRQDFLDKKFPETCRKCWDEEASGRTSKRMNTIARLKNIVNDEEWTVDHKPLMFLDLKLGNICNLKCRICGSWSSSAFATEEMQDSTYEDQKSTYAYKMIKAGAWPRNNPIFWEEAEKICDQIKYIEFTGGEPFMIREHFEFLKTLIDKGIAGNIEIHYNTNGTQYIDEAINIWKHFKLVEIAFSIDDVKERFEYQRSNANWNLVCNNIEKFKALRKEYNNLRLQVCCTVNVFNVYYLETVAQWIEQQNFDFVYWNMMHDSYQLSISTLPITAKKAITEKLLEANVNLNNKREFELITEFMNNGNSLDGTVLKSTIKTLDRRRNQNLCLVQPEFAKLIEYNNE